MPQVQLDAINDIKILAQFSKEILNSKRNLTRTLKTDVGRRVLYEICLDAEFRGEFYPTDLTHLFHYKHVFNYKKHAYELTVQFCFHVVNESSLLENH